MSPLLSILLALISLICLSAVLIQTRWTLALSRQSASDAAEKAALSTSASSAQTQVLLQEMTATVSKTLGAMVASQEKATSGMLSVHQSQTKQISDLVTLLATKDPMAYSQVRQTQVALGGDDGEPTPYPAVDDAAEAEARRKFIDETDGLTEYLGSMGIKVSTDGD